MITLYGKSPSRSNRAQWALEELELPYNFYEIDFAAGESRSEYFLKLNPAGKIPVLVDDAVKEGGELVLTESGAICTYLGDKVPASGLTPVPGTNSRAKYDQWMIFVQSELEQPMWTKAKHKFALPKAQRISGLENTAKWEFERAAGLLSLGLGDREFMIDDRFTMVDIMVSHTLGWAKVANFDLEQQNLVDYLRRNMARPAMQRMKEKKVRKLPLEAH